MALTSIPSHMGGAQHDLSRSAQELAKFIAATQAAVGAGVDRWELHQVVGDGQYARVDGWAGQPAIAARDLASRVDEAASADAAELGGTRAYVLAWYRHGENVQAGRKAFRKAGNAVDGTSPSEGPNAVGLVAQAQRHHEAMAFQYLEGTQETIAMLRRTVRDVSKDNRLLRRELRKRDTEQREMLTAERDLVLETHARSLETTRAEGQERRRDLVAQMAVGQLGRMLPGLLAKLAPGVAGSLGSAPGNAPANDTAKTATPSPGAPATSAAPDPGIPAGADPGIAEGAKATVLARLIDFTRTLDEETYLRIQGVLDAKQREAFEAVALAAAALAAATPSDASGEAAS